MPNRLSIEISPYLQQHAQNPVDWYPWGDEALERAQKEQKPIFLSIGYSACHWCHVMAHETFEDPHIAEIMNERFINIKVDREERPDIDGIYMEAVVRITGSGGWPLSVFLTPEGEPFYGGTYFPPQRRFNMPSFEEVLTAIERLWREEQAKLRQSSRDFSAQLRENAASDFLNAEILDRSVSGTAALRLAEAYDWIYGGWGAAPKFPQPMVIEFLLRRGSKGDELSLNTALHALKVMQRGGMHDLVGGGFARYSTDNEWRVPHFEKMLYDNTQLARVYLIAYLLTGDLEYASVSRSTLDFLMGEMRLPEGGFLSSLDADSEGFEGKYYTWSRQEVDDLLQTAQAEHQTFETYDWPEIFRGAFDITHHGQIEGRNVLQQVRSRKELADLYRISEDEVQRVLAAGLQKLRTRQLERVRPAADEKVLVAWNGLALWAFAEAARYLKDPEYLRVAQMNAAFLLDQLFTKGKLYRIWRSGRTQQPAFLDDYAALALGLLALYQTDTNVRWYRSAGRIVEIIERSFKDGAGGYFDTLTEHNLLLRPKVLQDNAAPCGNSLVCRLFGQYGAISGDGKWLQKAEWLAAGIQMNATRYPSAFGSWLCAADFILDPIQEAALLSQPGKRSDLQPFLDTIWSQFRPNLVIAAGENPPSEGSPGLLFDKPLLNQRATAYLCENFTCQQPVNSPEAFAAQLNEKPASL